MWASLVWSQVGVVALGLPLSAAQVQGQDVTRAPLFSSDAPLEIRLSADFTLLEGDRDDDAPERPALVTLDDGTELEAQVRTRGNFRRERANCFMPPLRINLKTGQLAETVFEGEDKLKIVGNCRPGRESYQALVLREYLAYRVLQTITDEAFRVRLARITYVDESGDADDRVEYGFFIEDEQTLARRLGAEVFELDEGRHLATEAFAAVPMTRLAIFQYMIGNTDWAEGAGHNVALLQRGAGAIAVPYDFDFSGLVDAPYATPSPEIGVADVRERRYLGWCRPPGVAEAVLADFQAARDEIVRVIAGFTALAEDERGSVLDYLAPFFDDIETAERARATFLRLCRTLPAR